MFHSTMTIMLLASIVIGIASADDKFEMEMAKASRSQVIDDDVKAQATHPIH